MNAASRRAHRSGIAAFAIGMLGLLVPISAAGQIAFSDPFNPVIAGVPVNCLSAGTGQRVAFVANPWLNDVGRARPGMPPTIEMNPAVLGQLPRTMQLFWYGHECAHHALGHTIGGLSLASESAADCWAVQTGRRQGFLSRADIESFVPYLYGNPGSPWGHLPGPQRIAQLMSCYESGRSGGERRPRERRRSLPAFCCTPAGRLGPYPNPGPNGIPVGPGEPCYGTHPLYGAVTGSACF